MATRVEISSSLAPLPAVPDLNDIRTEEKPPQRVYVSVLAEAGAKAKEAAASLSLEETKTSSLRSAAMPSLGSRPRLFPKPFSKEKPPDAFANVKPPVAAFRASGLPRKEEPWCGRAPGASVPPLVDQEVVGDSSKAGGEVVTNVTFYTGPSTNTVILFEAGGAEQAKVSLAPAEQRAAGERRGVSTLQLKELRCDARPEKPSEPAGSAEGSLHRQVSFCSGLRPLAWSSLKTGEKKDAREAQPEEQPGAAANSSRAELSVDVQQRPKPRPVSAIFLESLREQKHRPAEAAEEKPPAEKSWARKPRPLSMDLTARFEHRDPSSCGKTCSPHEGRENGSVAPSDISSPDGSGTGPKAQEAEPSRGGSSRSPWKGSSQDAGVLSNGRHPWETKPKPSSDQTETRLEGITLRSSERSQEAASESRTNTGGQRPDPREPSLPVGAGSPAAPAEKESSVVRGSVKKHISLFTPDSPSSPGDAELLAAAAEKENRCVSIQQRIRELTAESPDARAGSLRRSLQSRPLSADLTKMFSSPASSSEVKPPETRDSPPSEPQSKEGKLGQGTEPPESHPGGNPWRCRQALKITSKAEALERTGSLLGAGQLCPRQSEGSISFTSNLEKNLKPPAVPEKPPVRTVRATVFDHHVQRHRVGTEPPGTAPARRASSEPEAKPEPAAPSHPGQPWMGEGEDAATKDGGKQPDPPKQAAGTERALRAAAGSEDGRRTALGIVLESPLAERGAKAPPKGAEDAGVGQRVEPRFEVLQTCGERALSEAIALAPERKAVTLRAGRPSVKESRAGEEDVRGAQAAGTAAKALHSREETAPSEAAGTKGFPSRAALREAQGALPGQRKDPGDADAEPGPTAEKPPHPPGRCLGGGDTAARAHPDVRSDRGEASSLSKPEWARVLQGCSEPRTAGPVGTESPQLRTTWDRDVSSVSVSEPRPSSVLSGGQVCLSSRSHHPDVRALPAHREEPRGSSGLWRGLELPCKEQGFGATTAAQVRVAEPEERVRRTRSSVSDLKVSERWRRRTLPQDSVKTEDVVWLSPENIRRLSRTDSLQLAESSGVKRSRKSREGLEGSEGGAGAEGHLRNQGSAFEPRATYFAVTYQLPGHGADRSCARAPAASAAKPGEEAGAAAEPGRSRPPPQQPSRPGGREDPREVPGSQDWGRVEGRESGFSRSPALGTWNSSGRDNQQRQRGLDHSKEKIIDVDAFLMRQEGEARAQSDLRSSRRRVSSSHEHRAPARVAQDAALGPQGCDLPGRKAEDGYRSQILDIDALMAVYKEDSAKGSGAQVSEERGPFKSQGPVADTTAPSYSWKGLEHRSLGTRAGEHHGQERSRERAGPWSPEADEQRPKDRKVGPRWGSPGSVWSPPAEFTSKKTFLIDEDEDTGSLTLRTPKFTIERVQPVSLGGAEQRREVSSSCGLALGEGDRLGQKEPAAAERLSRAPPDPDRSTAGARGSVPVSGAPRGDQPSGTVGRADWRSPAGGGSAAPELRRSCSEKVGQGRDSRLLLPQEARTAKDATRCGHSCPVGTSDGGGRHKTLPRSGLFFHGDAKAPRKEWSKQSSDRPDRADLSLLPTQRSCLSFHQDRRADKGLDQLKQCFSRQPAGAKDTDTLVQEPDGRYGTWSGERRRSGDSFVPPSPSSENDAISSRQQPPSSHPSSLSSLTEPPSLLEPRDSPRDQRSASLDRSGTDGDSTDGTDPPAREERAPDFSFIRHTALLDSSALKTRVQLSKKRRRRLPLSHSLRRSRGPELPSRLSLTEDPDSSWMFKDSTEEKTTMQQEEEEEEEKSPRRATSSSAQRLPVFPGMDHSVLKAQLRRRQEPESPAASSPAQLFRSPSSRGERDERSEEKSPQWLKELRSKKRQSHHENQV